MERVADCFLLLFFILPSTIQYSLVVNDSEEVFTIDGQVYSSLPNLECLQQGVRCSSPEGDWTTCLASEGGCGSLDWQVIGEKVVRAREKLSVDVAEVEDNVKKVENDIKRTVQEIDSNLEKKMDRINSKIEKMLAKINKRF